VIYLQCHYGGIPPADKSAIYILSYDLKTGKQIERHDIYNPLLSRGNKNDAFTYLATDLRIGPQGGVWIYDGTKDKTFPLIRNGKAVPKSEHTQGVAGMMLGSRRILIDKQKGRRELVSSDNKVIRELDFIRSQKNVISRKFSSLDGEYFVKHALLGSEYIITTWDDRDIGRVTWKHKKSWHTYSCKIPFHLDIAGRLYRVFADYDGVYLYRWSK
jgi:hypothetical protein